MNLKLKNFKYLNFYSEFENSDLYNLENFKTNLVMVR